MFHNLLKVLRVNCIQDVEEVFPTWPLGICKLVLEVDVECVIVLEVEPQLLHRELIKVRNMNIRHLILLEQPLLIGEHLPEEILVHLCLWRQMVLDCKTVSVLMVITYATCQGRSRNPSWTGASRRTLEA